jgi:photosystem II stability/assembly factor-like uncharacterized protein
MAVKKYNVFVRRMFMFGLILLSISTFAQTTLLQRLEGKTTLAAIMREVDDHYEILTITDTRYEREWKHWKRWEWYMSSRLGHGGGFVHIAELWLQGMKEVERMATETSRNINSDWSFIGPSVVSPHGDSAWYHGIGRVDRIVFHPTNPNIIYACTPAGGLWNTLDGGNTWNNLTDRLPATGVSGFVISHANTSHQYILTGDGDTFLPGAFVYQFGYHRLSMGVYKSTDGGVSWHPTGALPNPFNEPYAGYALVQSPADANILIAATSNGIFRTTNGGDTWIHEFGITAYDLAFKPGDPTRVYASGYGDIFLSINSGDSWTSNATYDVNPANCTSPGGGTVGGRLALAVTPANPNLVYFLAGPVTGSGFCGLYKSTDSGLSFTRQSFSPNVFGAADNGIDSIDQSNYDIAIAVPAVNADNVIVAGCTVWRSLDGGISWIHSTSYGEDGDFPYIHPDVHDLAYNPLNSWLYSATDGGIYRSTNGGISWTDLSANMETSQIYNMAGWDGNEHKLMAGFQDNGMNYRSANSSQFFHILGGDGFDCVFNPDTGEPLYGTSNRSVVRFLDNGNGFSSETQSGYTGYYKTLAVHNTNPDTVLCGTYNITKSETGGFPWSDKGASGSWVLTSCPSNSNRFYAAGGSDYANGSGEMFMSIDIGETWTEVSENTGFPEEEDWVKLTDIEARPTQSATVYACFGGFDAGVKVFGSDNAGTTWTNWSTNLPNVPVNCLAVDSENGVYAGTDIGVFYLGPTVNQWMPWSNKLPNVPVTELVIFDDGTTKKIRAATFGRGIWESPLASTCDPAVIVTGNLEGIMHYEAGTSLTANSGFVEGGLGTFVSFQSGNYITLSEGFNVVDDSEFLGFISPCGQGGIPDAQGGDIINRNDPNASIISLRRMWDPVDGLPYGSIEIERIEDQKARVRFDLKNEGQMQLVIARNVQEQLQVVHEGFERAGVHRIDVDVSLLPDVFHYVLLFYEGKLVHYQELVKPGVDVEIPRERPMPGS